MRKLTNDERRRRLGLRHFLASPAATVEEAAGELVGLHSSDPVTVYLSARARLDGLRVEDLERALYEERTVVRMLGMRRTLFVVPVRLAGVMDAACTQEYVPTERRRLVKLLGDQPEPRDEAWLGRVMKLTMEALEVRGQATARELVSDVPELGTQVRYGQGTFGLSTRVLFLLATEGRVIRARPLGTFKSGQYRWTPTRRWLEGGIPLYEREAARRLLAEAWLHAYGPGTLTDLKWWTGWTVGVTREVLGQLDVVEVELDDGTGYLLEDDLEDDQAEGEWVAFLPGLDSTPMGWKERDWFLGGHERELFDRNGNAGPTVWLNGRIVGGWAQRRDGRVVYELLEGISDRAGELIKAEREALISWFDGQAYRARFPTPLEKKLRDEETADS